MKCPKCQSDNLPDAAFCEECGAIFEVACPSCGAGNRPTAKFCRKCRTPLAGGSGAATPVPEPRTPVAKHVADKILGSRAALEGERKLVTVLFADVKGSMEMAEQVDPEQWSAIMKRFFAILAEAVERFEGYVDKFTGDGIMALFGAPIAHEDHARRACYAALHIQDGLRAYANELRLRHGLNFSARMGLNSGEVVVGRIGDDLRMDYTAQGHTVGLAARMEQIAEPGKVYLTAHTARELEGYFALSDLGELCIKGAHDAVHVHELLGLGTARTRLDVSKSRGFSRFVGRGDEMQLLEAALTRARQGNGQVVGIVAEAGVGKSRLCYEFLERCRARGLMTYETTGVAHGKAIPFLPMLRLYRSFFGVTELDSAATARERIAGRLLLLDERLRASLPLIFEFMGVPDPENPAPRFDAEAKQRQMFDVVRRVTRARSEKELTVGLLEDLHWFDAGSEAFLEAQLDSTVGAPGLLILNFRPEYHAAWMNRSNYQQLALSPLSAEAVRELLVALLGGDPSVAGLTTVIHSRTAGNPFFVEEVVQSLVESGRLEGKKGAYRLVTPIDSVEVPSSVRALLAARIDRLAQREKDVLQTAAVIGREFDEPTLAAVVEQDAPQLREALQALKDAEFVHEQALYPVAEYLFKHPLTHEVALASQLQERRRRVHAAVAKVIEAAHGADLDAQAALLAQHWEEAGDAAQAVRWHVRAAEWAGVRDPMAGLRHWIKVRELGRTLDDAESRALRLRACGTFLGTGSWRLGISDNEVQVCLAEARALANALARPQAMAVPLAGLATHLAQQGRVETAIEMVSEAKGLLDDAAPASARVMVEFTYGHCLGAGGRIRPAMEAVERVIVLSGGDPYWGGEISGFSFLTWGEMYLGVFMAETGRFVDCWQQAARAIKMAREHALKENLIWSLGALALEAYLAGGVSNVPVPDLPQAAAEAVEIADTVGSRWSQLFAKAQFGIALLLKRDFDAAERELVSALEQHRRERLHLDFRGYHIAPLADAYLGRGAFDRAIAAAREGIEATDAGGQRFQAALVRTVMADALTRANERKDVVARLIAEARELVRKTGGISLLPRLREVEARLAGRADLSALRAGLAEAEAMWRSMGAPDPADRLAREIAALA